MDSAGWDYRRYNCGMAKYDRVFYWQPKEDTLYIVAPGTMFADLVYKEGRLTNPQLQRRELIELLRSPSQHLSYAEQLGLKTYPVPFTTETAPTHRIDLVSYAFETTPESPLLDSLMLRAGRLTDNDGDTASVLKVTGTTKQLRIVGYRANLLQRILRAFPPHTFPTRPLMEEAIAIMEANLTPACSITNLVYHTLECCRKLLPTSDLYTSCEWVPPKWKLPIALKVSHIKDNAYLLYYDTHYGLLYVLGYTPEETELEEAYRHLEAVLDLTKNADFDAAKLGLKPVGQNTYETPTMAIEQLQVRPSDIIVTIPETETENFLWRAVVYNLLAVQYDYVGDRVAQDLAMEIPIEELRLARIAFNKYFKLPTKP